MDDPAVRNEVEVQPFDGLTATILHQAIPGLSMDDAQAWAEPLNAACRRYGITRSVRRMAAFLGHIAFESGGLRRLEENLRYKDPKRIHSKFKSAFKTDAEAVAYVRNPEDLANRAYANKGGNGDEASGDGWRYRGRGLIQLTLKGNYAALTKDTKVDFVSNPELVATRQYAALSAAWYWNKRKLNHLADKEMYKPLSLRINRKLDSFAAREDNRKRALTALSRAILENVAVTPLR